MKYTTAIALLLNSTQAANTGTAGCECLAVPDTHANLVADSTTMVTVKTSDPDVNEYPVAYGFATCAAHDVDLNLGPDCNQGDSNPDWCANEWCYVAKTCSLTNHPSSVFVPADRCTTEPNYYYSYAACGATDLFTPTGYAKTRYDLACTKYSAMTEEQKTTINAANVEYVAAWVTTQGTTTACTGTCEAETDTCAQILVNDANPLLRCVPSATCAAQEAALQALVGADSSTVDVNCGEDNWEELSGVKLVASLTAALVAATMI